MRLPSQIAEERARLEAWEADRRARRAKPTKSKPPPPSVQALRIEVANLKRHVARKARVIRRLEAELLAAKRQLTRETT